ncbi:hypothetical protein D9A16_25125 [Vibrio parahaemolyticus]|nr:hypothetical protein [Vibrio parahaemolyticus]EGQ9886919.1 hypothetical protein [Vibrio parahaemolyticus]EGR1284102.1 hypothetical protein [Vibrio parahaemolyticus]EGR1793143.1 hypothetical protein [Vibrio parahaemolyticus]EGR1938048.1 hypothetical protein [Vibrio parahaemolyticus]
MLPNKAFKSDSQRLAVSLRSSIAKRCSHLNAKDSDAIFNKWNKMVSLLTIFLCYSFLLFSDKKR